MHKIIPLALLSSVLVACGGGESEESSSSANSSVASSSTPTSSAPASSSSVASSSSSSAASSVASSSTPASSSSAPSSTPAFEGDIANGKALFQSTQCSLCHTDNEDGTFTNNLTQSSYDVNAFAYPSNPKYAAHGAESAADLAGFIDTWMPSPTTSIGLEDAQDIAAYLWSLRGGDVVVKPQGCTSADPVYYGQRALKLLTSFEYHNSLQSLFGMPLPADYSTQNKANADKFIANLPNHTKEPVTEGRMNAYDANADEIAAWAVSTPGALPFDCTAAASCADSFLSEFAYLAFRRPLTAEEKTDYRAIITGATDLTAGLKWAVRAVLMSPQFLYRSELGIPVSQALTEGWGIDASAGGTDGGTADSGTADGYEAAAGGTTVNALSFDSKATGASNEDGTWNIYSTGGISHSFTFTADPSILVVSVKANDYNGAWPVMNVTVNGNMVAMATVDHYELVEYKYLITGQSGAAQVGIAFANEDAGEGPPWGVKGLDKNLYVGDVTVAAAQMAGSGAEPTPEPMPEGSKLELADANAYVLDPYEYAAALAYMFTAAGPDKELLAAAAAGELSDPAGVEAQIDRLMMTELGKQQVGRFAGLWLRTDGVVAANRDKAELTDDVKKSMAQEVRELFKYVFYNDVPYSEFIGGDFTMLDKTLSDFYGIPGGGAAPMQFAMAQTTERGGILTTGAFMAVNAHMDRTSPIKRSVHMREDLLCQLIPPPPASGLGADRTVNQAQVDMKQATGELTTAEFYEIQTTHESCDGCHLHIINPAFGMDDFDNIGLPRKKLADGTVVQAFGLGENGKADVPIEWIGKGMLNGANSLADAEADGLNGTGIAFSGAKDLSKKLAVLPGINSCLAEKAFRYTAGYALRAAAQVDEEKAQYPLNDEQKEQYACVASELETALTQAGSPKAMFKALGMSDVIRFRR